MLPHQTAFLELALQHEVLKFGQFTLKSGRGSPYFFNLGRISSGAAMGRLAGAYAQALQLAGVEFDMLFGPAYKGIPLATAVAVALAGQGRDVPYAYNRKEAKDHGEGGTLVGAPVQGRVVIVDDVLTAGTALREAVAMIRAAGAEPVAAVIALDRMEKGKTERSAVAEMEADTGVRVIPLVTVREILAYLRGQGAAADAGVIAAIEAYQARYGVN
ncbi:MAG: orotate phosphoribosyltransferase [Stagnimonas sp.]|nr:orotate phosphoribosyltransferase [Stagnimonas sp.]